MLDPSGNTSFIPKRGPTKKPRSVVSSRVSIFTYLSYTLIFAALLASGGVFIYEQYLTRQETAEIEALNSEIAAFSEADQQSIKEFDRRLTQAAKRLDNTVSVDAVLTALEGLTVETVAFSDLTMIRQGDSKMVATVSMNTDTFDSTLFQRTVLEGGSLIEAVYFDDVEIGVTEVEETETADLVTAEREVNLVAEIHFPISGIGYTPRINTTDIQPTTIVNPETTSLSEDELTTDSDFDI